VELLEPPQPPNASKPGIRIKSTTRMKQRTQTLPWAAADSRRDHIAAREALNAACSADKKARSLSGPPL
jgi:hypothetical protein